MSFRKSLLFVLSFISYCSFSQHTISGNLVSKDNPIAYATVMLNNAVDSNFVKAAISDSTGYFKIYVPEGMYFLTVKYLGFKDYTSQKFNINANKRLGKLELAESTNELKAIDVIVERHIIEIEPDKTIFNVQGTINASGSDGLELLRKAPGVVIDNNNSIIVEGKAGVQVYINGKLSILSGADLSNYLQSLQASDIDAIEIITQPSSKYDAAGNGGIINIKLKKDKKLGMNGTLTSGYSYGRNHRLNNALSFNHRNKTSNYYGNYSGNIGKRWSFINLNRTQEGFLYASENDNVNDVNAHNTTIGADWFVSENSTIGVLLNGNIFTTDAMGESITEIIPLSTGEVNQNLIANNITDGYNYQAAGNINYRFQDTLGHELTLDADYGVYNRDAEVYQPNTYIDGDSDSVLFSNNYRMFMPTSISFSAAKADYGQYLLDGKLTFGMKYSVVETENTFDFYDVGSTEEVRNENRSNKFDYTEKISAAYINYARSLSQRFKIQAGLRAELTNSRGELTSSQASDDDIVQREYLNFFPSGGLTFNQNKQSVWSLIYSRRITRPDYQSLNPFESQISELSYRKGNPFLQPQYATNVKLSHMFKYRLNTSLSYSYVSDFFAQINDTLGPTKSFLTPRNVANQQVVNLGVSLPFDVNKWWGVFVNLNANNTAYFGTDDKFVPVDINIFSFYGQNTFRLPWKLKFELSGWFSSPSIWGGTYLTKSMGAVNSAIERKFLDNNLSIRLAFNDMFFTSPWRADLRYGELKINGTGGGESRNVAFNVIYNFGNKNVKRQYLRETSLEEEKQRAN